MVYSGYARLELMGFRIRLGFVSEEEAYGGKLLRIDIPFKSGIVTEFYGSSSIYALTPISEEICINELGDNDPRPIKPMDYRLDDKRQHSGDDIERRGGDELLF